MFPSFNKQGISISDRGDHRETFRLDSVVHFPHFKNDYFSNPNQKTYDSASARGVTVKISVALTLNSSEIQVARNTHAT